MIAPKTTPDGTYWLVGLRWDPRERITQWLCAVPEFKELQWWVRSDAKRCGSLDEARALRARVRAEGTSVPREAQRIVRVLPKGTTRRRLLAERDAIESERDAIESERDAERERAEELKIEAVHALDDRDAARAEVARLREALEQIAQRDLALHPLPYGAKLARAALAKGGG